MPSMRDVAERSRLMRPNPGDLPGKLAFYRWAGWYGWRREFMLALHHRINAKGGIELRGRKTHTDYWWRMNRDARRLRDCFQYRMRFTALSRKRPASDSVT